MTPENYEKPWTQRELGIVIKLREVYKPKEIAHIVGRTERAIHRVLSLQKQKHGIVYPKLRHGRLKYDNAVVNAWREQVKHGAHYKDLGVHPVIVSRAFKAQMYGELIG